MTVRKKEKAADIPWPTVKDSEGNELTQRPFMLDDPPKPAPKRRGRAPKMIKVYCTYGSKIFLEEGRSLAPNSEGYVTAKELENPFIKENTVLMK